ncbi:MAG: GAF domain-containing protein [Chloroflexi bacterium]|nr:GAF domain-containing protein [Chloroflexota bacterium]
MAVVYEVGRIVTSTLDIQQVYEEFAAQLKKLVDFDRIGINVIDREAGTASLKYVSGLGPPVTDASQARPINSLRVRDLIKSGRTIVVDDLSDTTPFPLDQTYLDAGLNSLITVSLISSGRTIGTLILRSCRVGAYGAREEAILEILANQIAPAVENAWLYEESIQSQRAFQASDARFRLLMKQAADPLFLSDPDGRLVDVNDLACQGLGYTREELLEMRARDFSSGDPQRGREEIWERLSAGEIVTVETTHQRKDGTTFPVEIRVCLIELDGRQYRSAIARDITERKRAQEDQIRKAQEDSAMADIGRIISSSLDITEVYQHLGREIQTLIPFHRMTLVMVHADGATFSRQFVTGTVVAGSTQGGQVPLDGTISGRVYQTGEPVMREWDDDGEVLREFPGLAASVDAGLRSFLSVPLISRGNVIAVLQMRSTELRAYSQQHLDLAVRVANQISGAIAASQLVEQQKTIEKDIKASLREKEVLLRENSTMVEIGRIISSSLDLAEVCEPLGRQIQTLIPFQIMGLAILQADGVSFLPGWVIGAVMPQHRQGVPVPLAGTMAGRVIETGAPLIFEADSDQERFREYPGMIHSANSGLRSFMAVPLASRGKIIAVLQFRAKEPKAYSPQHLDLAVRVANQISGAIAASQLFQHQKESEEHIKSSLREKEVLLQEINHRVKNNLQIISSLLNLQSSGIHDARVADILQATQGRIRAMATIHDKLYQSEDLAQIDFGEYLKSLTDDMRQSYGVNSDIVELTVHASKTLLGVDSAIPCGLIVNELVSNALKHAFPAGRTGMIHVGMSSHEHQHRLTISDNGVGLRDGLDFKHSNNLGLRLVNAWVEQLGGTMELRRDRGVEVTIDFAER